MRPIFPYIGVVETLDCYEIIIFTNSPGKLIGTAGSTYDAITSQLQSIFKKGVRLKIEESCGLGVLCIMTTGNLKHNIIANSKSA